MTTDLDLDVDLGSRLAGQARLCTVRRGAVRCGAVRWPPATANNHDLLVHHDQRAGPQPRGSPAARAQGGEGGSGEGQRAGERRTTGQRDNT